MKPALLFLSLLLLFCSLAASSAEDSPPPEHCASAIYPCQPHLEAAAPGGIASSSQPQSIEDCCKGFSAAITCGNATCIFHLIPESAIDESTTGTSCIFPLPSSCAGKLANASPACSPDQICRVARKISATEVTSQTPPLPPPRQPPNCMRMLGFSIPVPAAGPPLPVIRVPSPPPPPTGPVSRCVSDGTGHLKFAIPAFIFFLHLFIL